MSTMSNWDKATALEELEHLVAEVEQLRGGDHTSPYHTRWLLGVVNFLSDVFGQQSIYYSNFARIPWQYRGTMAVHVNEVFTPGATEARYNRHAYDQALNAEAVWVVKALNRVI